MRLFTIFFVLTVMVVLAKGMPVSLVHFDNGQSLVVSILGLEIVYCTLTINDKFPDKVHCISETTKYFLLKPLALLDKWPIVAHRV